MHQYMQVICVYGKILTGDGSELPVANYLDLNCLGALAENLDTIVVVCV